MRVWDINPGYLNHRSLVGEHAEVHALISVVIYGKRGYASHPETIRWRDNIYGLCMRHELLVAEMELRGIRHRSPISQEPSVESWPGYFLTSPAEQLAILREKYATRESGRILLPRSIQELWAQHKYSVMARDPEKYHDIGRTLADRCTRTSFEELAADLVAFLRMAPSRGRLLNALQHMWGYVAHLAQKNTCNQTAVSPSVLINEIQRLVCTHRVSYLFTSTALSDLAIWV